MPTSPLSWPIFICYLSIISMNSPKLICDVLSEQWNFRVGFTPREGLVIHTVAYDDGSRGRRSVAHRLSFVEMVVPYGDPHDPHYRKNAFDAGEDGLGKNAHSLKRVSYWLVSGQITPFHDIYLRLSTAASFDKLITVPRL